MMYRIHHFSFSIHHIPLPLAAYYHNPPITITINITSSMSHGRILGLIIVFGSLRLSALLFGVGNHRRIQKSQPGWLGVS